MLTSEAPRGPWWVADRLRLLEAALAAGGLVVLAVLVLLLSRPGAADALWLATATGPPLWVLLLLSVPVTAWAASHPLSLARYGGAALIAFDASVLAFVLWLGSGSVLATTCAASGCSGAVATRALLAVAAWTTAAWLVGVALTEISRRGSPARVRLANTSLGAVAGLGAVAVAGLLHVAMPAAERGLLARGWIGPLCLLGIIGAAVVYVGVDFLVTALYVAASERVALREVVADSNALVAGAASAGVMCSAVLAALLMLHNPWSLALLVPAVSALVLAATKATEATIERLRGSALFRAAEACQGASDAEEIVAAVTVAVHEALHAPAVLGDRPPRPGETGVSVVRAGASLWLTVGRRARHRDLDAREVEVLVTFAALAGQALARVDSAEEVRRTAETDGLTGASTRAVMLAATGSAVREAVSGGTDRAVSVIYCDVDDFKLVNDSRGHRVGDTVLAEVARRLSVAVRPGDVVARLGGDEFAVLLPGADQARAAEVHERVRRSLRHEHDLGADGRLRVEVSLGAATWPSDAVTVPATEAPDWLLDSADRAMYVSKRGTVAT